MPKTEVSRAAARVAILKKRINKLSPTYRRKLTGDNPVSNLIEGLRATGTAVKVAFNAKKVDALSKKIDKLEKAQQEAKELKSTKRFMAGDEFAEYSGKAASLLRKAKKNGG